MSETAGDLPQYEPEGLILFHSTRRRGLSRLIRQGAADLELHQRVPESEGSCVLAVRASDVDRLRRTSRDKWQAKHVPPDAFLNAAPYLRPKSVTAAGGLVMRDGSDAKELLLIKRNGVWDLPKGKKKARETIAACARREVEEETGARSLRSGPFLASTMHGYVRNHEYLVKTTCWFAFVSGSDTFVAQSDEGITQVVWMPWQEAANCLGYEVLRALLRRVRTAMERQSAPDHSRPRPA